jgi:hypothetical protein
MITINKQSVCLKKFVVTINRLCLVVFRHVVPQTGFSQVLVIAVFNWAHKSVLVCRCLVFLHMHIQTTLGSKLCLTA